MVGDHTAPALLDLTPSMTTALVPHQMIDAGVSRAHHLDPSHPCESRWSDFARADGRNNRCGETGNYPATPSRMVFAR